MKRTKIKEYNPKKCKKWCFNNLVLAGNSEMIYNFYIYTGQKNNDPEFEGLQKCLVVVPRLSKQLHKKSDHKLYHNYWFTTLPLLHYLKSKNVFAIGTIRANRLLGCLL